MQVDPLVFKVVFVIAVMIAQGILWAWAGIMARRNIPGWSVNKLMVEFWESSKLQAGRVLAAVDRTFKPDRRARW